MERLQKAPPGASPLFHVRFTFDRTPLRRMHAALRAPHNPHFQTLPVRAGCNPALSLLTHCSHHTLLQVTQVVVWRCGSGAGASSLFRKCYDQRHMAHPYWRANEVVAVISLACTVIDLQLFCPAGAACVA